MGRCRRGGYLYTEPLADLPMLAPRRRRRHDVVLYGYEVVDVWGKPMRKRRGPVGYAIHSVLDLIMAAFNSTPQQQLYQRPVYGRRWKAPPHCFVLSNGAHNGQGQLIGLDGKYDKPVEWITEQQTQEQFKGEHSPEPVLGYPAVPSPIL